MDGWLDGRRTELMDGWMDGWSYTIKSSQISFIAWKIRKIGEASADTAATETYNRKGYYNMEEETIKVKI